MKTRLLSILYFASAIFFIFPSLRPAFLSDVLSKALIIPVLIALFLINAGWMNRGANLMIFIALFFSWAGDIALEVDKNRDMMFMVGLAFFLLAHVFYFTAFILTQGRGYPLKKLIVMILPVIAYGTFLMIILYDDLGDMRLPVVIYSAVILAMLTAAITRAGKTASTSFWLVLAGAALFVLSDSMIAVYKFSKPFAGASILIMSTYVAGQFLMVVGFIRQIRNRLA